jgi:excisionase family DNA binding protein
MPQATKKQKRAGASANHAEVLDLAGAAKFLRLPGKTVERLVAEQGLPGRKVGKEWRFLRAAIERWLEPGRSTSNSVRQQAGIFADDPDFEAFRRIVEENRKRWNEDVA